MRRLAIFVALSALFAGGLTAATMLPAGAASNCTGLIQNKTITGNLVVPGVYCELDHVTVTGNLTAQSGSQLFLDAGVHIQGNLTATNMAFSDCRGDVVQIDGDLFVQGGVFRICDNWQVRGNVTFTVLSGSPFFALDPVNVHINGNFTLQNSSNKAGDMSNWTVGGSGNINSNGGGILNIVNSTFGNALNCSSNATGFTGGANKAGSKAGPNKNGFFGQCAALGASGTP